MTLRIFRPRTVGAAVLGLTAVLVVLALLPQGILAQGVPGRAEALAGQNLRGYTHMFIAYFICWAIVLGWVVSIARRLGRVEKALKE